MSLVSQNTDAMREWCSNVSNKAEEFKTLVDTLYGKIAELTAQGFTGGVSEAFQNNVLDQKPFFEQQYSTMCEFASTLDTTAATSDAIHEEAAAAAARLGVN